LHVEETSCSKKNHILVFTVSKCLYIKYVPINIGAIHMILYDTCMLYYVTKLFYNDFRNFPLSLHLFVI
jgi:hypothetical protein